MRGNFHERFAESEIAPPSPRSTGLVFAGVLGLVGALYHANLAIAGPAFAAAAAFGLTSWLWPDLLSPMNRAWFRLSLLLNRIVNPVVMLLIYALAIVPNGLAMQLLRDPLGAKRAQAHTSYWIERGPDETPSSMTNQF